MDYRDIITIEPGKRSGKPCIRGMRITVQDVLEYLAGGMTEEEILSDFPELTHEDIRACLAFAANRERQLAIMPQYEIVAWSKSFLETWKQLEEFYPGTAHIKSVLTTAADDRDIWQYAVENGFAIVSKDDDFEQRSILLGHPPKVIWIRLGNCRTADIAALLQSSVKVMHAFDNDKDKSLLAMP